MNNIMAAILFFIAIGLIIADFLSGRKNNRIITFLTILIAAALPFLYYVIPEDVKRLSLYAVIMLVEGYLCLRIFTSKYLFLREPTSNIIEIKGGKSLIGFAILYNLATFTSFLIGFLTVVAVGGVTFWISIAMFLSFFSELITGNFSSVADYAGTGILAFLSLLPVVILTGLQALFFLITPIVLALRGLKGVSREPVLSKGELMCYIFFLILPYLNIFPMLMLWRKCSRYNGVKQ